MTDTVVFVLELIGTIAFAWSGAMTGIKKEMDIFGVVILGLVTAVGGGVIRDIVLDMTPPATFLNPTYALVAVLTSIIAFIPVIRRTFFKHHRSFDLSVLVMDSLGLGIFTAVGIGVAYESAQFNVFLFLFVGVITGIGGGILRDMLAGQTPYIFVKHFYASAALIGAGITVLLLNFIGITPAMLIGAAVTVVLRFLAAHFRWSLPKAHIVPGDLTPAEEKQQSEEEKAHR